MKQMRGMLTESIKQRAERYLGREFTQEELRLYPYLCYCAINDERVGRSRTTDAEQDIIQKLESEGRLLREYPSYMHPTRQFYMFMQDILVDTYIVTAEDMLTGDESEEVQ